MVLLAFHNIRRLSTEIFACNNISVFYSIVYYYIFLRIIFLFLEKEREREKEDNVSCREDSSEPIRSRDIFADIPFVRRAVFPRDEIQPSRRSRRLRAAAAFRRSGRFRDGEKISVTRDA